MSGIAAGIGGHYLMPNIGFDDLVDLRRAGEERQIPHQAKSILFVRKISAFEFFKYSYAGQQLIFPVCGLPIDASILDVPPYPVPNELRNRSSEWTFQRK